MTTNTALTRLEEIKAKTEGHTPGPWHSNDGPKDLYPHGWVGAGRGLFVAEPCHTTEGDIDRELIAAAPELETIATTLAEEVRRLQGLCRDAMWCISQGRVAVEDEQDMTRWSVESAPLQAHLERAGFDMEADHE